MIIDKILDRKDGKKYNARQFYIDIAHYGDIGNEISYALDEGTEGDVKKALRDYIRENDYNINIIDYINSINWL